MACRCDERSKSSVVVPTYQPRFSSPTRFVARDADVFEEDLVEAWRVGHVDERPDGDAGRLHVEEEVEMPRCFGASGSVRASMNIQSARWAPEVQIFWPLTT